MADCSECGYAVPLLQIHSSTLKGDSMCRSLLCCLALICLIQSVAAEEPRNGRPHVMQLALNDANSFKLNLLSETGDPIANTKLEARGTAEVFQLRTDESGQLTTSKLTPGLWIFTVDDRSVVCRVWTNRTAPPGAVAQLVLVRPSSSVVRGNNRDCDKCRPIRMNRTNRKYGVAILALGATAAYFAISRDNAS